MGPTTNALDGAAATPQRRMPQPVREYLAEREVEWAKFRVSVDGAAFCAEVRRLLEEECCAAQGELVDLKSAAALSGYSTDHLRRMVRTGEVRKSPNSKRPRFRRGDLPRKPGFDPGAPPSYDPVADARQTAVRRSRR